MKPEDGIKQLNTAVTEHSIWFKVNDDCEQSGNVRVVRLKLKHRPDIHWYILIRIAPNTWKLVYPRMRRYGYNNPNAAKIGAVKLNV